MNFIIWLVVGGLIGWVASMVMKRPEGMIMNVIVGIVGSMLIVYGLKLILQNGYTFPLAMLKRQLRFKELSMIKVVANMAEFAGKVGFAWAGFSIWCFVLGPLARTVVYVVGAPQ